MGWCIINIKLNKNRTYLDAYLLSALCISSMLLVLTSLIQLVYDKGYSLYFLQLFLLPIVYLPFFHKLSRKRFLLATFLGGLTSSLLRDSGLVGFAVPNKMVFFYLLLVLALYLVRHYLLVNKKQSE